MKKFASRILLLAAMAIAPSAFADNVLYIDPVFQVANSGATVTIDVLIDAATNISGFQFDLMYNPTLAVLVSQTTGGLFGDPFTFVPGFNDGFGTISGIADLLIGFGGISTTNGLLASFQFLMSGPGIANFDITNVIILDDLGLPVVTGDPLGGSVQVNAPPSVVPEPSTYLMSAGALVGLLALRRKR
jgi:hypothetical protein